MRAKYSPGNCNSQGFQRIGEICGRTFYEGPVGDEEPFYIKSRFDLSDMDLHCIKDADKNHSFFIMSPFYDVYNSEEWKEWLDEIRQYERGLI